MTLAAHFFALRSVHVACVALSGTLFGIRGVLRLRAWPAVNHVAFRVASQTIDSTLLAAAVLLTLAIHQYPFVNAWLTMKLLLLVLYVVLGSFALRRARTVRGRACAFLGALLTFAAIIGVAVTHSPWSWLSLLR